MNAKEEVEPVLTAGSNNKHNDTTVSGHKDGGEAQIADLPLADQQAYGTKGGPAAARWSQIIIGDLPDAH